MVVLTLIAVMLAGMKVTGQTVQEGTLMGTAIGTCFGYWLGASLFFFALAYFCDTNLSPIEVRATLTVGLNGVVRLRLRFSVNRWNVGKVYHAEHTNFQITFKF